MNTCEKTDSGSEVDTKFPDSASSLQMSQPENEEFPATDTYISRLSEPGPPAASFSLTSTFFWQRSLPMAISREVFRSCGCLALTAILALPLWAQHTVSAVPTSTTVLQARLGQLSRSFPGKIGIFVHHLEKGDEISVNADDSFPMDSTYKIPIMVQLFREADAGHLAITDRITTTGTRARLGGGQLLNHFTAGLNPTWHDVALLMITVSDNEATDLILKRVGASNVTATMRTLGIQGIRVDSTTEEMIRRFIAGTDPALENRSAAEIGADMASGQIKHPPNGSWDQAAHAFFDAPYDHGTPRAMGELLTKIYRHEAASASACDDMLGILQDQLLNTRIPRYLGAEDGLEPVRIAHKTGSMVYSISDVGIIYLGKQHIVLSVYTEKANGSVPEEESEDRIGRIAQAVVDFYQDTQ
jgi:beta-lactamase class A